MGGVGGGAGGGPPGGGPAGGTAPDGGLPGGEASEVARPQRGQNRLPAGISPPQLTQFMTLLPGRGVGSSGRGNSVGARRSLYHGRRPVEE